MEQLLGWVGRNASLEHDPRNVAVFRLKRENTWPRHLYLIRHGQYFDSAQALSEMKLTILGKEQLKYTGIRLNQMNIRFNRLIHSGMVRAVESATVINEQLDSKLPLIEDTNLTEGLPIAPVPYAGISQRDVDVRRKRSNELPSSLEINVLCSLGLW